MNTNLRNTHKTFIANDRGMSFPVAILLGLVTTGIAIAVIAKTQTDKGKTVAQVNAVKSSTIAESGVNQYLDFLNKNRILLTYPSCVNLDSSGACSDSGSSVKSWYNASSSGIITTSTPSPNSNTCPKPTSDNTNQTSVTEISTKWANASTDAGWQSVDGGQYKLVQYSYTPNGAANTAPGNGTLIVEGRTNVNGSGANATNDPTRTARTRIAITIPVTVAPSSTPSPTSGFPALWAKDFKIGGSSEAYGNVWDSYNCLTGTQAFPTNKIDNIPATPIVVVRESNNGNAAQYSLSNLTGVITPKQQDFPDLPNNNTYTAPTGANVNTISCPSGITTNETFPRTGDKATDGTIYGTNAPTNATYVYKICADSNKMSIDLDNSNITLGRSGQEKFVFYLDGTLKIGANGDLSPLATGTTKTTFYIGPNGWLNVGANGNLGLATDPTALQFYMYARDGGTINQGLTTGTTSEKQSVQLQGNGSLYGFVFAPFANAKIGGTGDIAGAVWAKSYEGGGNGSVLQGVFDASRLDVSLNGTPVPTLGQATSWQRQPVP